MTNLDTYPTETMHELSKPKHESAVFYERSKSDPLVYAFAQGSERSELMAIDQRGLEEATSHHNQKEIIEFATDLAYLSFIEDTGDVQVFADKSRDAIQERLADRSLKPAERLVLRSKLLDIQLLQVFDAYHSAGFPQDSKAKENARQAVEASSKNAIIQGTVILAEMHRSLIELRKGTKAWEQDAANDLVGRMFELLYVTNRRRQIYGAGDDDKVLALGVTEFQDSPALQFDPNHNFDFMEIAADGRITGVVQCKARDRGEVYDDSIKPISGRGMYEFFDDPIPFIQAIQLAISDQEDPRYEPLMKEAIKKVDSLFISNYKDAGSAATRSLVSV